MAVASGAIFYFFIFLTVYVQVFFLVTLLENRKHVAIRRGITTLTNYPEVTVIVPAFNEEKTLRKTVESLFNLNYPKEKLKIFLVDDGSRDRTYIEMQKLSAMPGVRIFKKENGGKHTALNLGLEHAETPFVGCLDADSMAHPEALARIVSYFQNDPTVMAVTPSLVVHEPKTLIQTAQKMEYLMSIYSKKMLGFLGAIHVTPGPLTIFRKRVFDELGPYRSAHNTEDMEIAYRMQKNHFKIEHCHDAYVFTGIPRTLRKLFRQRLRWIYGFINNTIDYRGILFRKKYGNFSFFTVPAGIVTIFGVCYILGRIFYNLAEYIYNKFVQFKTIGFTWSSWSLDPFFISTRSFIFLEILIIGLVVFSIMMGQRIAEGRWKISWKVINYFLIFSAAAPFWLLKAIWRTLIAKQPAWK